MGLVLLLLLTAGCRKWESQPSQAGQLEAHWVGADSGRISAHAAAEWCADRLLLEIRAIRGDTGLAVVLFPVDTIVSDSYPVVEPAPGDSARPSARVALRVFAPTAIKGYQGDSGAVLLELLGSGQLSGRLAARARSVPNGEQVRLTGKFERIAVRPQQRGCISEPNDTASDTVSDSSSDTTEDGSQGDEGVD